MNRSLIVLFEQLNIPSVYNPMAELGGLEVKAFLLNKSKMEKLCILLDRAAEVEDIIGRYATDELICYLEKEGEKVSKVSVTPITEKSYGVLIDGREAYELLPEEGRIEIKGIQRDTKGGAFLGNLRKGGFPRGTGFQLLRDS